MSFTTLTAEEERELYRLQRLYWREALRCEKAKAYLAGCILLGSALETLLILMINVYPEEAERTGKAPSRKGAPRPLLDWRFSDLLRVAKAANWLPAALDVDTDNWDRRKARIGDYAEVVREVRDLVHPTRYVQDHHRKRVTARYLQWQFDVAQLCRDWLAEHNTKSLREHMKAEGIL